MDNTREHGEVVFTKRGVSLGGRYEVLLCGSLFYFRLPRAVWKDRIAKLKRAGYNCVDVYFPWNYHERADGSFDFAGERDVRYFLGELRAAGMYVIARPGPYICSEWNGGGIPARILESGMPVRCNDDRFLAEAEKWYRAILGEIAPFTYPNGGTVIMLQVENELDFFDCPCPEEYVARLLDVARSHIRGIPCFCCAGQYHVARAGGALEGVEAALNCYPDSLDPGFDGELAAYAQRFAAMEKPLLVSETNRDHFLLRRELSCGAKLLGAYNQVAGINFDYNQAVNNWGSPDAMLMTEYDFESMIDAAGNYRPEAEEAVLFSAFLRTVGGALASALPSPETVSAVASFKTTEGGLRVLELADGGAAVCVPNFSERGKISFTFRGHTVCGEVPAMRAPFYLFDFDLAPLGIRAKLTRANCEPIAADAHSLVFYGEGAPQIGLDFGDGEHLITGDEHVGGIHVRIVGRSEALSLLGGFRFGSYRKEPFEAFAGATLPGWRPVRADGGLHFGALGLREGAAEYELRLPAGKELFIEHPCDLLKVAGEGIPAETRFADGRDVIVPASADGRYTVTVEKWGHSNFDDSQSPSIRIACKKGVLSFGMVATERVGRCDFALLDSYGDREIGLPQGFPVRLSVDKWNSTRKPVICAYSFGVTRTSDRLLVKTTENTDVAVYLDGKLLGECDFGTFELTGSLPKGEHHTVTLVYRKHVWTQNCGDVRLLHIDTVHPQSVRVRAAEQMTAMQAEQGAVALPLSLKEERGLFARLTTEEECFLRFMGHNVKLTCVMDGRVIGRLILDWPNAPTLTGGDPGKLYLCPAWSGELFIFAEPLGEGACISGAELLRYERA